MTSFRSSTRTSAGGRYSRPRRSKTFIHDGRRLGIVAAAGAAARVVPLVTGFAESQSDKGVTD